MILDPAAPLQGQLSKMEDRLNERRPRLGGAPEAAARRAAQEFRDAPTSEIAAAQFLRALILWANWLYSKGLNVDLVAARLDHEMFDGRSMPDLPVAVTGDYRTWWAHLNRNRGILLSRSESGADKAGGALRAALAAYEKLPYHIARRGLAICRLYLIHAGLGDTRHMNLEAQSLMQRLDPRQDARLYMIAKLISEGHIQGLLAPRVPGTGWFGTRLFGEAARLDPAKDMYLSQY